MAEDAVNYETTKHIRKVQANLFLLIKLLLDRAQHHDDSKLEQPEVGYFTEHTHKLASLSFGSEEYKANLKAIEPALKHHYANNRHHPNHFKNGIDDMNLIDLVEMLCDWRASAERQNDGNVREGLYVCAEKFNINPQLLKILENTIELLD